MILEFCAALMEQIASTDGALLLRRDVNSAFVKYNRRQSRLIFGSDLIARTEGRLASLAFQMIDSQKFIVSFLERKTKQNKKKTADLHVSTVSGTCLIDAAAGDPRGPFPSHGKLCLAHTCPSPAPRVINACLDRMLEKHLTLHTNDPRDLPESSHIKKTLEHPHANSGRLVGFFG